MCFRCPIVLGTKEIQPSPFWCVLPHTFQILTVMAPSGVLVIHVTQGLGQYPATCKGEDNHTCPACCWGALCPGAGGLPWGSLGGVGRRGKCSTWEGRKQRNWTEVGLGNGSLSRILKTGSLNREISERDPASNFPLPLPELVQGLEECPWSVGPVVVCHPFKCSHFQVTILSLALPWAEHVWHTSLTFMP